MQTKLTLRVENDLIKKAKQAARKRGKSLSKMVSEYFYHITKQESIDPVELPPIVKSMYGKLSDSKPDELDYKEYLETKHL